VPFADFGRKLKQRQLTRIVLLAAVWCTSLFEVSRRVFGLDGRISYETLRQAVMSQLPSLERLERELNRALIEPFKRSRRLRRIAKQPCEIAIDTTLRPYHGRHHRDPHEIVRGQPKAGTSHFHAYATAYLIHKGARLTLALRCVRLRETMNEVVRQLLADVRAAGIRPRRVLLDRGFASVEVIRYLHHSRTPFVMPLVARGKGIGGNRPWFNRKVSGCGEYTLTAADGHCATVYVVASCRNRNGERGKHGRQALVYATWGVPYTSHKALRKIYRRRFGIESSYRQAHQAWAKTSSRDPRLRLLYVALALILRNVWWWLHVDALTPPCKGGRRVCLKSLRFSTMLWWIAEIASADPTFALLQSLPTPAQTRSKSPFASWENLND